MLYAGDGLTVVEGTGINRGWADYRDRHLGPELKEMKHFRYPLFELEARTSGEVAWVEPGSTGPDTCGEWAGRGCGLGSAGSRAC